MLSAITQVETYTVGLDRASFAADPRTVDAVMYRIAVIGEAATALPESVRAATPQIPWKAVRGMRNRLLHEYFGVRLDTVWETVGSDLPALWKLLLTVAWDALPPP